MLTSDDEIDELAELGDRANLALVTTLVLLAHGSEEDGILRHTILYLY